MVFSKQLYSGLFIKCLQMLVCPEVQFAHDQSAEGDGWIICEIQFVKYIDDHKLQLIMGNFAKNGCGCFTNQINQLIGDHMEDMIKFVTVEEGTRAINTKYTEIRNMATGILDGKIQQGTDLARQPLKAFSTVLNNTKNEINGKIPGGVSAVEKIKGESIEKILGIQSVKFKLQSFVEEAKAEATNKKSGIVSHMDDLKEESVVQLKKQRPVVPVYDQLPGFIQNAVYEEVSQRGKDQIAQNKEKIIQQISDKVDVRKLATGMLQLKAVDDAKGLLEKTQNQFKSRIKQFEELTTAKGMAKKVLNFF